MPQFWGGFIDDKLDTREIDTMFGGPGERTVRAPMLFTSRTEARKEYKDVRKVEVRVVSRKVK